ncbi:MAG: aminoacyl-tRNA hydrolase [Armatimonadota bacterium]|nr:aminoacyl-tRNA hydrolase [Armatimonadota bacterium]MDR7421862.1 aminoacyl-tRNA hydrolase [Armatimonadota bacterium]MDR7452897.1 aminoacyl-tRNA hydrolase [Armatimonadota bacterium]MDR7456207.1 aminoacyl-tRNA hydrolase [Armatimonadota bacterium]MDR7496367.1 aminoacyl-tRNA hydrolase [Armatimonadota bacterium]
MRLVVGLGNPGRRYRHTRHNIGWEVVDRLAALHRIAVTTDEGWAQTGRGTIRGQRVLLARPETYMNASGAAVADLRRRHRVPPEHLLVILDDLDLPVGALRLREKGSHGGHNGLRSIIEELGTSAFPRLRIGIGRPPAGVDPADYVLERPPADERRVLDEAVTEAAEGVERWIADGIQAAMRYCNGPRASDGPHRPDGTPARPAV